jgi:DUF4097 and DUF4098 domain-containing protein YvlB
VNEAKTVTGSVSLTDVESDAHIEAGAVSGDVTLRNVRARRLSLSIVTGTIDARNVIADQVTASSMSGDIAYAGPIAATGRYEFKVYSGAVRLGITGNFDLETRTFSGRVDTDQSLDLSNVTRQRTSLKGTVGQGGGVVIVTAFNGNIAVGRTIR